MDRTVKLHQREFDTIPEVWGRLTDTFVHTLPVVFAALKYPNVDRLTGEQLNDLVARSPLADRQKNELKDSSDKNKYYSNAMMGHNFARARDLHNEFHDYLVKNGIFIPKDIKSSFLEFDDLISAALRERQFSLEFRDLPTKFDKAAILYEKGPVLLKSLEVTVNNRLWTATVGSKVS